MIIKRKSIVSGKVHVMDINITPEELSDWENSSCRPHIQNAFPKLPPEQREFILTGITPEEWDAIMPPEEDEELWDDEPAF